MKSQLALLAFTLLLCGYSVGASAPKHFYADESKSMEASNNNESPALQPDSDGSHGSRLARDILSRILLEEKKVARSPAKTKRNSDESIDPKVKEARSNYRKALRKAKELRVKLLHMDPSEKQRSEDFKRKFQHLIVQERQNRLMKDEQKRKVVASKAAAVRPSHHMVVRLELPPEVAEAVENAKKLEMFKMRYGGL